MTFSRSILFLCLCACMSLFAQGCAKPRIELQVASQPNVNPDHSGRPSPVIIKMYELRGDLAFRQSDFQRLFHEPMQALGADLIAADEVVFVPGEARTVAYSPMPETKFVGLVAGFRQMERANWRNIVPVDAETKNIIRIEVSDVTLMLHSDEDWSAEESLQRSQGRLMQNTIENQNAEAASQTSGTPPLAHTQSAPEANSAIGQNSAVNQASYQPSGGQPAGAPATGVQPGMTAQQSGTVGQQSMGAHAPLQQQSGYVVPSAQRAQ